MGPERKFSRFNAPLYIRMGLEGSGEESQAIAKDISMGGLKIVFDRALTVAAHSNLVLFLLLPERTLRVSGEVVWVRDYGDRKEAGISFLNLQEAYKEDLYNYIFKYYPKEVTTRWWQM